MKKSTLRCDLNLRAKKAPKSSQLRLKLESKNNPRCDKRSFKKMLKNNFEKDAKQLKKKPVLASEREARWNFKNVLSVFLLPLICFPFLLSFRLPFTCFRFCRGFPVLSYYFHMFSSGIPLISFWYPSVLLWMSFGFPLIFLRFSFCFPVFFLLGFLWFSFAFLRFWHGSPYFLLPFWFGFLLISCVSPLVFLWPPCGFPWVSLWNPFGIPSVFLMCPFCCSVGFPYAFLFFRDCFPMVVLFASLWFCFCGLIWIPFDFVVCSPLPVRLFSFDFPTGFLWSSLAFSIASFVFYSTSSHCFDIFLKVCIDSFWYHFAIIWVSFWVPFWGHVGVILGSFWGHVGVSLGVLKGYNFKQPFFTILDASWGPSWAQVGTQFGPSWHQNRHLTSLKFSINFWIDFGASWSRFLEDFGLQGGVPKWA